MYPTSACCVQSTHNPHQPLYGYTSHPLFCGCTLILHFSGLVYSFYVVLYSWVYLLLGCLVQSTHSSHLIFSMSQTPTIGSNPCNYHLQNTCLCFPLRNAAASVVEVFGNNHPLYVGHFQQPNWPTCQVFGKSEPHCLGEMSPRLLRALLCNFPHFMHEYQ